MIMFAERDPSPYIEHLKEKFSTIHVIVSPPRCASTALARIFWQHPNIRYYAHEPFETTYYQQATLIDALNLIDKPIDLLNQYKGKKETQSHGLIIKEMPYQVGGHFSLLATMTHYPIIFLIRDPRLNVFSRIQKKLEVGASPIFPLIESGWKLLDTQIKYCQGKKIPFVILKSDDLRNDSEHFTKLLMEKMELPFSPDLLSWQAALGLELDNLSGVHSHLYLKVLASTGILPANEKIPEISAFPEEGGIRNHVEEAMQIYSQINKMNELLRIEV